MSSLIPGQNTDSLAFSMHFSIPWCPSWVYSSVFHHRMEGMRSLELFVTSPSSMDSSSWKFQYRCNSCGSLLYSQGHPMLIYCIKTLRVGSFPVSPHMLSNSLEMHGIFTITRFTAMIGSWIPASSIGNSVMWLSASASGISTPFLYTTFKGWYGKLLTIKLWILREMSTMCFL